MEQSVQISETYGIYTHTVYSQNAGICGQNTMYSLILTVKV